MEKNWDKKYIRDLFVATLVIILPFLIYIHLLFSRDFDILLVFGYEVAHNQANNQAFTWYVLKDLIPLLLLLIWFSTNILKWRLFIVPSICILCYSFLNQLAPLFFSSLESTFLLIALSLCISLALILFFDKILFRNFKSSFQTTAFRELLDVSQRSADRKNISKAWTLIREKKGYSYRYLVQLQHLEDSLAARLKKQDATAVPVQDNRPYRFREVVIIVLLLIAPMFWMLHVFIPQETKALDLGLFTLGTYGFGNVSFLVFFAGFKLFLLVLMLIWYFSSRDWWRYAILSPILLYTYQFWETFQDWDNLVALKNLQVFPAVAAVVLYLVLISKAVKYKTSLLEMHRFVSAEVESLLGQLSLSKEIIKEQELQYHRILNDVVKGKKGIEEQLSQLLMLRNKLINKQ